MFERDIRLQNQTVRKWLILPKSRLKMAQNAKWPKTHNGPKRPNTYFEVKYVGEISNLGVPSRTQETYPLLSNIFRLMRQDKLAKRGTQTCSRHTHTNACTSTRSCILVTFKSTVKRCKIFLKILVHFCYFQVNARTHTLSLFLPHFSSTYPITFCWLPCFFFGT